MEWTWVRIESLISLLVSLITSAHLSSPHLSSGLVWSWLLFYCSEEDEFPLL